MIGFKRPSEVFDVSEDSDGFMTESRSLEVILTIYTWSHP